MILGPLFSHFVIDKFVAQLSVMISLVIMLIGISIGAYTGTFTIAGPIIQASLQDLGLQMAQITNRRAIYDVAPKARNRVNTTYMIGVFCGQLAGTAIGNRVYAGSGWTLAGTVNLALVGVSIILCLLRGPKETGWIGWTGGISVRRSEQ
jgi:predicted MFS family arabinose efflux permease